MDIDKLIEEVERLDREAEVSEPFHITLTPALLAHLEQVGLVPGTGDIGLWLIERAETLAALLAPVEDVDLTRLLCEGDPCCHCGTPLSQHRNENHGFVELVPVEEVLARALVQARAHIAEVEQERDAALAEVARLKRALVEPTEQTGDEDSEQ